MTDKIYIQTQRKHAIGIMLAQSKNIHDYKDVFCLTDDFSEIFLKSMMMWCELISRTNYKYWEVFLIRKYGKTVGVCGLYSLFENFTKELWLGWLGIVPGQRSQGIGNHVIYMLIEHARRVGCTKIYSYVEEGGDQQMKFYKRLGFERICNVGEYLSRNKNAPIDVDDFMHMGDDIIFLDLDRVNLSVIEL